MRQGIRFFLNPVSFMNQLQWSRHHWVILGLFTGVAFLETHLGLKEPMSLAYIGLLQSHLGVSLNFAIWFMIAAKLALLLVGAWIWTHVIWLVGSILGNRGSKRVFFRRTSIALTLLMAAHTVQVARAENLWLTIACVALYFWGMGIGYLAIRNHFGFNHLETVVVGSLGFLLLANTWQYATLILRTGIEGEMKTVAVANRSSQIAKQSAAPRSRVLAKKHAVKKRRR